MIEAVRGWVMGLAGAAAVTAICTAVTPEGRVRKVVALICGFVLLAALLRPAAQLDYGALDGGYMGADRDTEIIESELADTNEKLTERIIAESCAAYILDKGTTLGLAGLSAEVTLGRGEDGQWYPLAAEISGEAQEAQRRELESVIEQDLGIAPGAIIWRSANES